MRTSKNILLAGANPKDTHYLDELRREIYGIMDALKEVQNRREINLKKELQVSFKDLFDEFNKPGPKYNLFHFCGHSNAEQIILHDDLSGVQKISNDNFVNFLKIQTDLEVIFLNSCCSETLGELILKECSHIQAVIETTTIISDRSASEFAQALYKGLNGGKCLYAAFNQAYVFKGGNTSNIEETTRSVQVSFVDKKDVWKISFNDKKFVEEWVLVKHGHHRFFRPEVKKKLAVMYDNNAKDIDPHIYFDCIKNSFRNNHEVATGSFEKIMLDDNSKGFLESVDFFVICITNSFLSYWDDKIRNDTFVTNIILKKSIIFLGCSGDVNDSINLIIGDLKGSVKYSIFPKDGHALAGILKGNIMISFNSFCRKEIHEMVTQNDVEDILIKKAPNLNFKKQIDPFESDSNDSFEFYSLNLIMIEGTEHCAQELLIRRILSSFPTRKLSRNNPRFIECVKKNITKNLTLTDLIKITHKALLGHYDDNVTSTSLQNLIRDMLVQQDLVIILNEIPNNTENDLLVLREFWNEIVCTINCDNLANILYLFFVHKEAKANDEKNKWSQNGFNIVPSKCNVLLLDIISPLSKKPLQKWLNETTEEIEDEKHPFHTLLDQKNFNEILRHPQMSEAIGTICELLKCPNANSEIFNLNPSHVQY